MTREEILLIVKDHIKLITGEENVLESENLEDIGLDSLDQVELFMMLEKEFKIDIQDSELAEIKTVGQVIDVVEKNLPIITK